MHRTILALASGLLTVACLVTLSGEVHADVVGPPPSSCPPGSTPSSSHAGPLCTPAPECTSSTMCTASGASCMAVAQCIEERACGGRLPPDAGPCVVEHVVGPCAADGTCSTGTCRQRSVCATAGELSPGGCGCRAGSSAPPQAALASFAVLGLFFVWRRSRR